MEERALRTIVAFRATQGLWLERQHERISWNSREFHAIIPGLVVSVMGCSYQRETMSVEKHFCSIN